MVSYFCEGSKINEQLLSLPIYLIRDIANFLKLRNTQKYLWLDMSYFDVVHDYTETQVQMPPEGTDIDENYCMVKFSEITNLYQEYLESSLKDPEEKQHIRDLALNFKQMLRKENKKRRKSSAVDEDQI